MCSSSREGLWFLLAPARASMRRPSTLFCTAAGAIVSLPWPPPPSAQGTKPGLMPLGCVREALEERYRAVEAS